MSAIAVEQQERDRRAGVIVTIIFHALLILLFLFFGLQQPNPLPEETGIELVFEDAGGLTGGASSPAPSTPQAPSEAVPAPASPEEVATEEESAVEVPKPVKPQPKPNPKPAEPKPPKPNPNALFTPSGTPSESTSSSPGGGPPGDKPGDGGIGSFHGQGFEGRLDGRGLMRGPNITDKPSEGGKVALNIWVDRSGKVTRVSQNLDKSTTTSQVLFNIAKKGAMQCTFSAKPDGLAEQMGLLIFVFELE